MKFRARMTEIRDIQQFHGIISWLEGFSKRTIIRVCPDRICFIASSGVSIIMYSYINSGFFDTYVMEGNDKTNEICFEVALGKMKEALSKSSNMKNNSISNFIVKLTNRAVPCITFQMDMKSDEGEVTCCHDFPLELIYEDQMKSYEEPTGLNFQIGVEMRHLELLSGWLNMWEKHNTDFSINVTDDGSFSISLKNMIFAAETFFPDLVFVHHHTDQDKEGKMGKYSVNVYPEKFAKFLSGDIFTHPNSRVTCDVSHDNVVRFRCENRGFFLNFYAYAVSESEESADTL